MRMSSAGRPILTLIAAALAAAGAGCQGSTADKCAGVVCQAKDACHEVGQCDSQTGACSDPVSADAKACEDGNACTENDHCSAGACRGTAKACQSGSCNPADARCESTGGKCAGVVCQAKDACHEVGQCDPQTGACSDPISADAKICDDGDKCTENDHCSAGICRGAVKVCQSGACDPADGICKGTAGTCAGVVCQAKDACHEVGQCDPKTGACSEPVSADTKTCDDGDPCTENDHCSAGNCGGTAKRCQSGSCDPGDGVCKASTGPKASVGTQQGGAIGLTLGLAYDEQGFVYEAGNLFQPGFDFGSGLINSAGNSDVFVVKLNPATGKVSGAGAWAKDFGDKDNDQELQSLAVSSGQVGLIGRFTGLMDLGGGVSQNNTGQTNDYVAALHRDTGAGLWIKSFDLKDPGLVTFGKLNSIASSPAQTKFAVCGYVANKVAPSTLVTDAAAVAGGGLDAVVAVFDAATGNVLWGKQFGGAGDQICSAVAMDDAGDVIITGQQKGTLVLGTVALPSPTGANSFAYFAKLDGATGAVKAAVNYGATPSCRVFPRAINVDGSGNVLTTGQVQGKIMFGTTTLTATGTTLDVYIAKLDSSLTPVWAQRLGGTAADDGRAIAADSLGQVWVTGAFDQTTTGVAALTTYGGLDAFLLRLDPADGHATYADHFGDPNGQEGQTLVAGRLAAGAEKDQVWTLGNFVAEIALPGKPKLVGSPETRKYLAKMK